MDPTSLIVGIAIGVGLMALGIIVMEIREWAPTDRLLGLRK